MFNVNAHKPTQYPAAICGDVHVDDTTHGPLAVRPKVGRTVCLYGWVSTYNVHQLLQLLEIGDAVATEHPTTGKNLTSIAFWDEYRHNMDVHPLAGKVRVQRVS